MESMNRHTLQGSPSPVAVSVVFVLLLSVVAVVYAAPVSMAQKETILSLLPPLVAIGLALAFREVILALLLGVLTGSLLLTPADPGGAFVRVSTDFIWNALADKNHAAVVLFSLMLAGMVGILSASGGTAGLVALFSRLASSRRGGLLMTYLLGIIIFFDDYANTLLVGYTMRPFTDKLKISRAKLAYIVDSTAAPVVSIAVVSTWVGFEVGLLKEATAQYATVGDAYILFLQALPYRFYSIFALCFVLSMIIWGRDAGPMLRMERGSSEGNDTSRSESPESVETSPFEERGRSVHAWIAVVPIVLVTISTFIGLYLSGKRGAPSGSELFQIIGRADSSEVLMGASFIGLLAAGILAGLIGKKSIRELSEAMLNGIKAMIPAMAILLLAWALGDVCNRIGTAQYLIHTVSGTLSPYLVPTVIFIVAGLVSFSTGTSWGTMAILIPIAVPLAHDLPLAAGLSAGVSQHIFFGGIGSVLAGATFGDHCSPISDTTIMSSMASGCDHVAHVRTQIPYAITAALVAIVCGYLPAGLGVPGWIGLAIGIPVLFAIPALFRRVQPD